MSTTPATVRPLPPPPNAAPLPPALAGRSDLPSQTAISDAALFTAGNYAANALLLVAGLLQKAILGPVATGYWALMQTAWTFFSIAPLGAQHGATRQIPAHRGRGDFAGAEAAAGTGASFSLAAISVLGCVVAAVAVLIGGSWAPELRFGLILLGVTAPLRFITDAHEVVFQAIKRFDVASTTVVVKAVLALTLQTAAVYALGFYGLFLGLVAIELGVFALWLRMGIISRRRPAFRFGIDRIRLRELIRYGAPIMVTAQVWLLFQAVDSLIIAGALDVRHLGYYALAVSVTTYVLYLPKSIGAVLFPRMMESFARTGEIGSIQHYATDVQRLLAYMLVPLAVAVGFFAFPVLIRHALPEFEPAITVVQIMVAATFFMALMNMPIKVLLTAGYRWSVTALVLVCLAVNAGLNYAAVVLLDQGIEGAAVATAVSYLVTFLLTTGFSLSRDLPLRRVALHLAEMLVVFANTYGALRLVEWALGSPEVGLIPDAGLAALKLGAFLLLMAPWVILAERRLRGLTMIREVLRHAGRRLHL